MEYNLAAAIEHIRKREETGLNYIYSKTYNYVYLRAKNVLKRENDIAQFMQDVYIKLLDSADTVTPEGLYEWLGKSVYTLGSACYRKKKAREADFLEIEKNELETRKNIDIEKSSAVIAERLEELPDLYQATFYAFYHDFMSVQEIAEVMDVSEGIIMNRLNYTRKYMIKALSDYQEEQNVKVAFGMEAVKSALRQWSVEHCLGITNAQFIYAEICKKAELKSTAVYLEGKEFAGVNNTVVYYKADDWSALYAQFEKYAPKKSIDKKQLGVFLGAAALVIAIILGIILFVTADKGGKEDKKPETNQEQTQNGQDDIDIKEQKDQENQEQENRDQQNQEDQADSGNTADTSEYILPESNVRELSRDEISHLSKEQLRLARNEIFARHGMIFGVEDLDEYFSAKSWYSPTVSAEEFYDKVEMSLIEEENINLIVSVEGEK